MNRFVFVLTAVLALVLALVTSPALAQDDPASVINAFFDARSRGDATAALELFAEDAVYDGVGLCGGVSGAPPCVGKSAIAPEIERLISGSNPTVTGTEVSGNVVTVRYEVRGARPQAAGVERIINVVTAEVQGGKITSFHVENDTSDPQTATFVAFSQAQAAGVSRISAFYAALNAGEADTALALFADEAKWTALTGETVVGKEQIQRRVQNLVARNQQFEFLLTPQAQRDTVTWRTQETYEELRKLCLDAVEVNGEAVIQDGKITAFRNTRTPESEARYQAALADSGNCPAALRDRVRARFSGRASARA